MFDPKKDPKKLEDLIRWVRKGAIQFVVGVVVGVVGMKLLYETLLLPGLRAQIEAHKDSESRAAKTAPAPVAAPTDQPDGASPPSSGACQGDFEPVTPIGDPIKIVMNLDLPIPNGREFYVLETKPLPDRDARSPRAADFRHWYKTHLQRAGTRLEGELTELAPNKTKTLIVAAVDGEGREMIERVRAKGKADGGWDELHGIAPHYLKCGRSLTVTPTPSR